MKQTPTRYCHNWCGTSCQEPTEDSELMQWRAHDFRVRQNWVLLLSCCVTWGKLLSLSESWFPQLVNKDNANNVHVTGLRSKFADQCTQSPKQVYKNDIYWVLIMGQTIFKCLISTVWTHINLWVVHFHCLWFRCKTETWGIWVTRMTCSVPGLVTSRAWIWTQAVRLQLTPTYYQALMPSGVRLNNE